MIRRGVGRVGRPGLIGTAARTAVVAGTATAVSGRVASKREAKAQASAQQAQQPVPPPPPPPSPAAAAPEGDRLTDDAVDQLKKLAELRDAGVLTDEEFAAKKASILGI